MDTELQRAMTVIRHGGLAMLGSQDVCWLHNAISDELERRAEAHRRTGMKFKKDIDRLNRAMEVPTKTVTGSERELHTLREEVRAALAGLQSTDEPLSTPEGQQISFEHDRLLHQLKGLDEMLKEAK